MDNNPQEKKVDDSWKEKVDKEKEETASKQEEFAPINPDFKFFITTLALQAAISLGDIPNPATNKKEQDLVQSKFMIDTLTMLQEKTKGNLNEEESKLLENVLYELRMQYVSKAKKE
ncbi:MAG: DUF1844 domain-containing protein [Candidatus Omnitrophica bacterium]|jgi:uncharacterized protein YjaG (DUF416 family)|nr:DUF1844 domain-containing protein [Candidatus Omnitrophota bacterium]